LQTNLKRLLAYSTIAHAGYMLMGLAVLNAEGAAAVLFYLVAYLFMNLGAFAIVAFLRNQTGSEDLSSYRGLVTRAPLMTVLLTIFLLSLLGIPPLAGFAAKFQILSALFDAGQEYSSFGQTELGYIMYTLLAILVLNTALSAVYYLKVIKVMILDKTIEEVEGRPAVPLPVPAGAAFYGTILAAMIFVIGIAWNPLAQASDEGVSRFQKAPGPPSSEGRP
jgi:NADH-quinone oxidoreductase subunit N